jgi:hypothetical protein
VSEPVGATLGFLVPDGDEVVQLRGRHEDEQRVLEAKRAAAARRASYFDDGGWSDETDWWAMQLGRQVTLGA